MRTCKGRSCFQNCSLLRLVSSELSQSKAVISFICGFQKFIKLIIPIVNSMIRVNIIDVLQYSMQKSVNISEIFTFSRVH